MKTKFFLTAQHFKLRPYLLYPIIFFPIRDYLQLNFSGIFAQMFNCLRQKWDVSWLQLVLIFCTFALGGSLCGYLGRWLLSAAGIGNPWIRIPLYIVVITILWPFCVLLISIFFGQFSFFKKYLGKLWLRIRGNSNSF